MKNRLRVLQKVFCVTIFIFTVVLLCVFLTLKITNKTKDQKTPERKKEIEWQIEIPEDYNLKEYGMYYCDYFGVYYFQKEEKFYVKIIEQEDFTIEEVQNWIIEQLKQFPGNEQLNKDDVTFVTEFPGMV
ncbi:hypothetical protein JW766_03625 [Candidatus Dojkabacteria bacterium]|nr:hypothetical protein [Candidatus Dojkabacteria bacterium]